MSNLSLSIINRIEKQIRDASGFQYISSDKSEQIIEALRQISIRSGMAIYIWSSNLGLVNIKSRQTPLPATRSVLEALKYASKNHYFAVYVFPGNSSKDLFELKSTLPKAIAYLKTNENTRFLFITDKNIKFNFLSRRAEEIILHDQNTKRYKLRDGQWVLSDG